MRSVFQNQYLATIWAVFIVLMCCMPTAGDNNKVCFFEGFDKVVHLGLFFVFVVLLFYGNVKQYGYSYHITTVLKIILLAVALGASTELLQWKVFTYRSGDWWDFFADTLGVAMGTFSYLI